MKKLSIGTHTFEKLRNDNFIYVDKTGHIYNLINNGSVYFLSRPRRFGKSLLISTLEELFKANKDLFEGLYIWDKWDWSKKNPVIRLDFTEIGYKNSEELEKSFNVFLDNTAKRNNVEITKDAPISVKFAELIEQLHKKTEQRVVILIDEYDKPLIDNLLNKEIYSEVKRSLHNFYQVIKAGDKHIQFVLLTGVSQFSGLSIFSGLNNLNNITLDSRYSSICGYTQEELESSFKEYIESTSKEMGLREEELLSKIKYWYNGYSWDGKVFVYNPFSTLKCCDSKEFIGHWFETGTPTFLIEEIRKKDNLEICIERRKVGIGSLKGEGRESIDTTALLFQTGYMTIKEKKIIEDEPEYVIDFPNNEVERAFISSLMKEYTLRSAEEVNEVNKKIKERMRAKDAKGLEESLKELFANIPYDLHTKRESYYHSLFLLAAKMSGYEVEGEVHTDKGRIDVVIKGKESVVVVEIKYAKGKGAVVEKKIKEAMKQIRETKYYEKYKTNKVSLLAIAFGEKKEIRCRFEGVS
ncbi:MAG: ATP-binding protein [Endomicrobium sp.]|nr:ATP-binding protein [Endomicrobium sp.]